MLVLTRKVDEVIMVGDDIKITVCSIKGNNVRIGIDAPPGVRIYRKEIFKDIHNNEKHER